LAYELVLANVVGRSGDDCDLSCGDPTLAVNHDQGDLADGS
jgi:hypothetical protein